MATKIRIDFTFPTEQDYFEFMSALDNDMDYIQFKCKVHRMEEEEE